MYRSRQLIVVNCKLIQSLSLDNGDSGLVPFVSFESTAAACKNLLVLDVKTLPECTATTTTHPKHHTLEIQYIVSRRSMRSVVLGRIVSQKPHQSASFTFKYIIFPSLFASAASFAPIAVTVPKTSASVAKKFRSNTLLAPFIVTRASFTTLKDMDDDHSQVVKPDSDAWKAMQL